MRSKKRLEKIRQDDIITPKWLFKEEQTPFEKTKKKVYKPKTLKQIARGKFKTNVKELETEIAKKSLIHIISLMKL